MEKFDSITHFLQSGEFEYRVFDMGRKVVSISNRDFEAIENQQNVYPYPFQQKAWLALLFWSKQNDQKEPVIWFLQFPVDELGYLSQESRDGFLIGLLEQAGKNIQAKQAGDAIQDELNESPFAFKPQADRLAMFHAFATVELGQAASQYYQYAHDYLLGDAGYEQWQFLGLQGIADVVARLSQDGNEDALIKALPQMPSVPLQTFSQMLEHISPEGKLVEALSQCLEKELADNDGDVKTVSALLRSLSASQPDQQRKEIIAMVLESNFAENIEVIVAVSGRAWVDLRDSALLMVFIEKLSVQSQEAFNAVLVDLMMLPDMRNLVLNVMRNPKRSDLLSQKLSEFMRVIQTGQK